MPRNTPSSAVRARNGPGRVLIARSSISRAVAGPEPDDLVIVPGALPEAFHPATTSSWTSWTPSPIGVTGHPSGGATPASATIAPGPASAARSAQSAARGRSGRATNGDTSAG